MCHDFKTLMIESKGILPKYREFIFNCDMTSAYEYHKKFLQVLQAEAPGVWNCKKPSHSLFLEYLFKIYPDARVVWTHRDPYTATGSLASLIQLSHNMFMGKVDYEWLGENYSWQQFQHCNRVMDFRDKFGEERKTQILDQEVGKVSLEDAAARVTTRNADIAPVSGRQEFLENLMNEYC